MRSMRRKIEKSEHLNSRLKSLNEILLQMSNSQQATRKNISTEILGLFNIEALRAKIKSGSQTPAEKRENWEKLKVEIINFTITTLSDYRLLDFHQNLKDLFRHILMEKFRESRGLIEDCDDISEFIFNEFYDQLFQKGLKNIALFIKQKVGDSIASSVAHNAEVSVWDVFDILNVAQEDALKIGSKLKQPDDNLRWSSCSLQNLSIANRGAHRRGRTRVMFTDFNMVSSDLVMDFEEEEDHEFIQYEEEFRVLPLLLVDRKHLSVPKNQLDLVFIFVGDMDRHKFFADQDFIERYIISADKNSRAEKYRPGLGEIREEIEESAEDEDDDSKDMDNCEEGEAVRIFFYEKI